MVEYEKLQVDYWSEEERKRVALRIDKDIFTLQEKERDFQRIEIWDLKVFEKIDTDVNRLSQIKQIILFADTETLEANRARYRKYI
ncbi:MAG: hypothetical protein AABX96_03570 [Nanoarchaeota archaeon]